LIYQDPRKKNALAEYLSPEGSLAGCFYSKGSLPESVFIDNFIKVLKDLAVYYTDESALAW
jgi:hypothetical protein